MVADSDVGAPSPEGAHASPPATGAKAAEVAGTEQSGEVGGEPGELAAPRRRVWSLQNIVTTLVVGAVIAGVVWFVERPGGASASQSVTLNAEARGPAPEIGKPAPDFEVQGLDGTKYKLSDFRGRPVWIFFWASWCPPCRAENPDLEAAYTGAKDSDLVMVGIDIGEDPNTVKGYATRTGLTFPIGLDLSTEIAATYRIAGIPTHYFVDRDGILRDWRIGGLSKKTIDKKVVSMLAPAQAPAK